MDGTRYDIRQEAPEDWWEVEALLDLCFAPGRTALSSYRLREGIDPVARLCLVARDADAILAAAIRFWPVLVGASDALLLGPIAVHPTRQGEGLGGLMIRTGIERAKAMGQDRILLVGDAPYYGRFGFSRIDGVEMPPPTNPARVLAYDIPSGAWDGVSGQAARITPAGQASP